MEIKRSIAIDLDGTILREKKPFMGIEDFGKSEKKVRECLVALRKHGFYILIHTTRLNPALSDKPLPWLMNNVENALIENGIPFDGIFSGSGKPLSEFYVDDRAVTYAGNWEETMKEIISRAERSYKNVF